MNGDKVILPQCGDTVILLSCGSHITSVTKIFNHNGNYGGDLILTKKGEQVDITIPIREWEVAVHQNMVVRVGENIWRLAGGTLKGGNCGGTCDYCD
jgi:hypothetical protein